MAEEQMDTSSAPEPDNAVASTSAPQPGSVKAQSEPDSDGAGTEQSECDRQKMGCLRRMIELERQFQQVKDMLYSERSRLVDQRQHELDSERSTAFVERVEVARRTMDEALRALEQRHKLRVAIYQNEYDCSQQLVEQDTEADIHRAYCDIEKDLQSSFNKLKVEKCKTDLEYEPQSQPLLRTNRSARRLPLQSHSVLSLVAEELDVEYRKKPVQHPGPCLVYMLRDQEIEDDFAVIEEASKETALADKMQQMQQYVLSPIQPCADT